MKCNEHFYAYEWHSKVLEGKKKQSKIVNNDGVINRSLHMQELHTFKIFHSKANQHENNH